MGSLYLNRLSRKDYEELKTKLWETQGHRCFICEQIIDLELHGDTCDIDHIIPLTVGGKDDSTNFALTHASCNRSKQSTDLDVARLLARFQRLQGETQGSPSRPNLSDVLHLHGGAQFGLPVKITDSTVQFTFPDLGDHEILTVPLYHDQLGGVAYFFANLPIAYITHDDHINPRAIAANSLRRLIEEFHAGLPQLQPALAWTTVVEGQRRVAIRVFDGQHKAAAQVLLGMTKLPLRVFVNPDLDKLLTANTHAGTTLRQVAFDKSVQRHLGSQLFADRVQRYLADLGLPDEYRAFSEKELVDHFKGQWREVKRYILDDVRDSVTHHPDNLLKGYIDFGGRSSERPLSYSSIEKTFYSFFIFQDLLRTPIDYMIEQGDNPRELEKEQILRLMNIVAEQIYVGKFDPTIGTNRIERRLQEGEALPLDHVRSVRMSKEEILYTWLGLVKPVVENYFLNVQGMPPDSSRLFQQRFPAPLWELIQRLIANLAALPLWTNTGLSETVFGGKQPYDYWRSVFQTGQTPSKQRVLAEPVDIRKLIS